MHANNHIPNPNMAPINNVKPPGIIANNEIPVPQNEAPKKRKWWQKIGDFATKAWGKIKGVAGTVMNIPGVGSTIQGALPGVLNKGKDLAQQGLTKAQEFVNQKTKGKFQKYIDPVKDMLDKKIESIAVK